MAERSGVRLSGFGTSRRWLYCHLVPEALAFAAACHPRSNKSAAGPAISWFGWWTCCGPFSRRCSSCVSPPPGRPPTDFPSAHAYPGAPPGASWGSQGMISFASTLVGALQQVSDVGGAPQELTRREKGEVSHRWPEFLPGGKAVLFAAGVTNTNWTNAQIAVHSVATGERRNLIQGGMYPRFAPSGHLVYA